MEPLDRDDPQRIGPYRVLARIRESAGSVRYLALAADGTPYVVALVRPALAGVPAYRRRFGQETRRTQRLAGGWVEPVEASTDGPLLWTASAHLPAVTLREAIALAGPLPERAVRVLGAALAETLSRVHATGTVLQGLSPDTVLLAADGPRLTALGALGAAVVAEPGADGRLTVKLGYLTPEQAAGAEPGPASDVFVLGQLLTYAATGTTPLADAEAIAHGEPELAAVPDGLRAVVARCLAKPAADRPAAGTVAADLALEGAAALARETWLPSPVTTALAAQAAEVTRLAGTGADGPDAGTGTAHPHGTASPGADTHGRAGAGNADAGAVDVRRPSSPHHSSDAPATADAAEAGRAGDAVGRAEDAGRAGDAIPAAPSRPTHGPATAAPADAPLHDTARPAGSPSPAATPGEGDPDPVGTGAGTAAAPHGVTAPGPGGEDRATMLVRRAGTGGRPPSGKDTAHLLVKELVPAERRPAAPLPVPRPEGPAAGAPVPLAALPAPAPSAPAALPAPAGAPPALPPGGAAQLPYAAAPLPPAPTGQGPAARPAGRAGDDGIGRRGLLLAAAAGVAGLLAGGTAVGALAGGEEPTPDAPKPGPTTRPRPMAGFAPAPQWRYEHPAPPEPAGGPPAGPLGAVVWRDRLLLLTDSRGTSAVDLRTGRRVWTLDEAASATRVVPVGTYCVVDTAEELLWVSAADGKVGRRLVKSTLARPGETLEIGQVLGSDGPTAWFTAHVRRAGERTVRGRRQKVTFREAHVIAYDLAARAQQWRARVPEGASPHTPSYQLVAVRGDDILVRQDGGSLTPAQRTAARNGSFLHSLERATGKVRPGTLLTAVGPAAAVTGDASGRLYAAAGGELHAYAGTDGRRVWRVAAANTRGEPGVFAYGTPLVAGPVLYAANRFQQVCAVDTATGRELWRRSTQAPAWRENPVTALSPSGRTVLTGDAVQLTAFAARDGRRLWKFQEAGADDAPDQAAPRYAAFPAGSHTVVRRGRTFYALPVD
ncbi:PQQ-binding-like beta-propeller repeat protein [Streptomyces genisteinicus]|uniref:PQQ-binding-like beta-propeller repeat protein n=1 Tax=Streptomyces genisteinicus TaxID=2768068 RepID=A0A7H0HXL4_9ACTN|nr:PQQ-binding-like beta-propeller repeat protein [Streptomyces genisteinicus]QNP65280.1 PQQ-binding-like beta-propeller repeat protein [Streptomyces genisteinicus]